MKENHNNMEDRLESDRALHEWFATPLGRSWQAAKVWHLRKVLPRLFGTAALQIGCTGGVDLLDSCVIPSRIHYGLRCHNASNFVRGIPEALPFDAKSIDVVLMPHTLDFTQDPHQVLREVQRVLSPDGHAVIIGFNPLSLWGAWRMLPFMKRHTPWDGLFLSLFRLKDWLRLLDFEATQGAMFFYRPPFSKEGLMSRLYFLDKIGDRWWPMTAAGYILVAKKRVLGVTPLRPDWEKNGIKNRETVSHGATRGVIHRG